MSSLQQFDCIFCKESFGSKEELQIHFRKHGDPKFNQSLKSNVNKNQSDMGSQGEQGVTAEVVNCDVCSEVFPTISKAITHKHKMHPDHDAKYFCPWCGKLFTMKHLYNKHIQTTHDDKMEAGQTGFHCDYCEVDFFVPSAMLYHNKFFHRQDTELAAIGHSKKLKLYNEETIQIYYCPFCGEEYCNKVNLHKHMGDDHIDENQSPEEVLRCPLCEAVFYHLDAYELHLTFHSSVDLYSDEKSEELAQQVTEYSLETVSPIMEKVENESQEEGTADASQIEDFLQQALNETIDQDHSNDSSPREKKKKHKKHKKSKKEKAITLDEFLTMNTDVFGEGINFQGIEEVPTQIVAKQLKKKPGPKPLPSELVKLKKQGLVIKKNPAQTTGPLQGVKIRTNKPVGRPVNVVNAINKIKATEQNKVNVTSSPNDVLSKFLNQSNSQIKIVKKSSVDNTTNEISQTDTVIVSNKNETQQEVGQAQPPFEEKKKNNGIEGDTKDASVEITNKSTESIETGFKTDEEQDFENLKPQTEKQTENQSKVEVHDFGDHFEGETKETQKVEVSSEGDKVSNKNIEPEKKETSDKLNILHNFGQHLTIKSLSSPKKNVNTEKDICEKGKETHEEIFKKASALENESINRAENKSNTKSLNVLRHLSHLLTVKPLKSPTLPDITKSDNIDDKTECTDDIDEATDRNDNDRVEDELKTQEDESAHEEKIRNLNATPKFNALKNLGSNITIKSVAQSSNNVGTKVVEKSVHDVIKNNLNSDDSGKELDKANNTIIENIGKNKNLLSNLTIKKAIAHVNPEIKQSPPNQSAKLLNKTPSRGQESANMLNNTTNRSQSSVDLVKRLPNVVAKPVAANKVLQKTQTTNPQKNVKNADNNTEMEIFNIDDSDDEYEKLQETKDHSEALIGQQISTKPSLCNKVEKSKEVLKSLGKNITVKPTNQSKPNINDNLRDFGASSDEEAAFDNKADEIDEAIENQRQCINKNSIKLHNRLKQLSGVTIKSKISESNNTVRQIPREEASFEDEEYNSDSDMSGKVKITELPDDFTSDDDIPLVREKTIALSAGNVTVQEPDNSGSDLDHEVHNEDDDDIESKLKPVTVMKPQNFGTRPACLNNLKNVTIKSSKEQAQKQYLENPVTQNEKQNKELSLKPFRPCKSVPSEDVNDSMSNAHKIQNSAQVNTVSKQISVQTFKTQTVIQEVTTTVTKTIRTVNQTVQQEMRNMNSSVLQRPQKIQGIRPNQQIRNMTGKPARPTVPNIAGTRIRTPTPAARPVVGTSIRPCNQLVPVRPSNQLVPVRPAINVPRPSNPNMKRPAASATTSYRPVVGRPLKIAASALVQSQSPKRPATSEANRPFSCFKKPKESLIPGVDEPEEADEQFSSSSQVTRSSFMSTTESVKGNSVVTSTQLKSEFSASSEQLSRLNSLSGLKIVKSSQAKQASQVEETTDLSASKRSALAAIEKLQKQGLLVKKPRIDEPDDNEHSNSKDDFYDT